MLDDQLLKELQAQGLMDDAMANRLRRDALIASEPIESIIWRQRLVDPAKIAEIKSTALKVPYQPVDPAKIDAKLLTMIPEDTARTYATIPLSFENGLLVVGMVNPDDTKAQDAIKFVA